MLILTSHHLHRTVVSSAFELVLSWGRRCPPGSDRGIESAADCGWSL